jgi:hypothetical protein
VVRWAQIIRDQDLKQGDPAKDFTLSDLAGISKVTVSHHWKRKPVVLAFGSVTCPHVRGRVGFLNTLYKANRKKVEFYFIYIREAHPAEDGNLPENAHLGVSIPKPTTLAGRAKAAGLLQSRYGLQLPLLLDELDDRVAGDYHAWPDRCCIIGVDGRILFAGGTTEELAATLDATQ